MNIEEVYEKIKPTIVAFVPKFYPKRKAEDTLPKFPPIFGTGFIVADGIVCTNSHVFEEFNKLPRPSNVTDDVWSVMCLFLHFVPGRGVVQIMADVLGGGIVGKMETGKHYYGPPTPDLALVKIKMKDLPKAKVKYESEQIKEGREIATAGFPMGTDTLMAPGYLHQLTPTLQRGIISAVLPFECNTPHALMINIMSHGGASGSPVFLSDSEEVIGVLYAGLEDIAQTVVLPQKKGQIHDPSVHVHNHKIPTNLSYVVPAYFIEKMLEELHKTDEYKLPYDTPSLAEKLEEGCVFDKTPEFDPYSLWGIENNETD